MCDILETEGEKTELGCREVQSGTEIKEDHWPASEQFKNSVGTVVLTLFLNCSGRPSGVRSKQKKRDDVACSTALLEKLDALAATLSLCFTGCEMWRDPVKNYMLICTELCSTFF